MSTNDPSAADRSGETDRLPEGFLLGDYRILRLLGRGGMGEVYEAEHLHLGRRQALKVLPTELAQDLGFRERFRREARVLASLEHPHIVAVDHASEAGGRFFLAMELMPGSLAQEMSGAERAGGSGGLLSAPRTLHLLRQMLEGLEFAHSRGVVHRDLKPANILLDARGSVKLGDFGVAQVLGAGFMRTLVDRTVAAAPDPEAATRVLARSGAPSPGSAEALVGTVDYMAPEVRRGGEAGTSADLFAIGVIAYEMLTSRKPLGRYHDASALVPGLDPRWDAWINRALQPDPGDRWPSASRMKAALEELITPARVKHAGSGEAERRAVVAPPAAAPAASGPVPPPLPRAAGVAEPQPGREWTVPELRLEMRWIPPGRFVLGSPPDESGRDADEGPTTEVSLTQGYWLGRFEVTQAQWQALMGINPSRFKMAGPQAPVEQVSWNDVQAFCRRLNEKERGAGRLSASLEYTLPSEAQWEYACRAGLRSPCSPEGVAMEELGWFEANSGGTTHPVGGKRANAWGLHDMHGNVWEWCADGWGAYPGGSAVDLVRAAVGSERVYRGGGWNRGARFCRSAYRGHFSATLRHGHLGFRLALVTRQDR